MKFSTLAEYLQKLEDTSSRIGITEILAALFNETSPEEIDKTIYLLLGGLAPKYDGVVFNLADQMVIRALASAYDIDQSLVNQQYKKLGDLGLTANKYASIKYQESGIKAPTINDVHNTLLSIAKDDGEGSQERKVEALSELLKSLDPLSVKFVTRIPIGKLRLGFSDKTIIDAISWMVKGDKSSRKQLENAYRVLPDVGILAKNVKIVGIDKATTNVKPVLGVPVLPMLCGRIKSPKEMVEKMGEVAVEPKLDGLRILIHFKRGRTSSGEFVKAFTRNLNETSWMFPELDNIGDCLNANEAILDTEAVGLDEVTKKMANFQTTMTRRRKHDIENVAKGIGIQFYVFDILLLDGKNLMDKDYLTRRSVLAKAIKPGKLFKLVDYKQTKDPAEITKLHAQKIKEGLEGIIVKRVNSKYIAGRTGWRWVKMKEAENSHAKLSDTVDTVIMGYTRGKGKRAGFGMGQFLAGIIDGEKIKTVTKVGTGLTDVQLATLAKRLHKIVVKKMPKEYVVDKKLIPDFWVEPNVIVELAGDELTKSPSHSSGYALRFPRLITFRDDKDANMATTSKEVRYLYKIQ